MTGDGHQAGACLYQKVIPGLVLFLARPKAGNRTINQRRIEELDATVIHAEPAQRPSSEIFNKYVRLTGELLDPFQVLFIFQVGGDRTFIPIYRKEIGRLTAGERRAPMASVIAAVRMFHLDYVSP